jgi:hypothetical protein
VALVIPAVEVTAWALYDVMWAGLSDRTIIKPLLSRIFKRFGSSSFHVDISLCFVWIYACTRWIT